MLAGMRVDCFDGHEHIVTVGPVTAALDDIAELTSNTLYPEDLAGSVLPASREKTGYVLFPGWGQRLQGENDLPPSVHRILDKQPRLQPLRAALWEFAA